MINRVKNSINQQINTLEASESLYEHYTHLKTSKKSYCAFCQKKECKPPKKQDLRPKDFSISEYQFNLNQNIEIERSKKQRKRGKQTF